MSVMKCVGPPRAQPCPSPPPPGLVGVVPAPGEQTQAGLELMGTTRGSHGGRRVNKKHVS